MRRRAEGNSKNPPRDDWNTPAVVLDPLRRMWPEGIDLDPCSNRTSIVGATTEITAHLGQWERLISPETDGLSLDWSFARSVFVNPPYSHGANKIWAKKIHDEAVKNPRGEIVALVPACPGAKWFSHYWDAEAICFWSGRITFPPAPWCADFESALVYFGRRPGVFGDLYNKLGHVVSWRGGQWDGFAAKTRARPLEASAEL